MVNKKIENELHRIKEKELGLEGLSDILARESLEKINPILIRASRERSANRLPHEILRDYEFKNDFYGVSTMDQRKIFEFGSLFYSVLPDNFSAVEVSPISPLGLNSVLTRVSQDISLSTTRGSEVVSDPTTPLILECAKKRKKLLLQENTKYDSVELATMKRVLRLQPFDKEKGYMQHFNLLGLCSAGRDNGMESLMIGFVKEHISIWLDFIEKLSREEYVFDDVSVKLSDISILEHIIKTLGLPREVIYKNAFHDDFDFIKEYGISLPREVDSIQEIDQDNLSNSNIASRYSYLLALEQRILDPLRIQYPDVRFCFDFARKAGLGYYNKTCYHIYGSNHQRENIQIADGGSVDWLSKVMNSNKERAVTSGFGAELIQKLFRVEERKDKK